MYAHYPSIECSQIQHYKMSLSEVFINKLEERVHAGKKPKHMTRARNPPCRFIDSQARERKHDEEKAAQKKKEKKNSNHASKKGKRKHDDLEESDDESVGHLVSKHCKSSKRFGVRKSYEQAEEREAKKARYFLNRTMTKVLLVRTRA